MLTAALSSTVRGRSRRRRRRRVRSQIEEFKTESPEYFQFLREQLDLADIFDCATTVADGLRRLGVDPIGPLDFEELGVVEPALTAETLRADIQLIRAVNPGRGIELSYPPGCPTVWPDRETNFASFDRVIDHLCPPVESGIINKDPERYVGQCFTGWGHVVQFDTVTGPCRFHMNIGDRNMATYDYDVRAEFSARYEPCEWLDEVIEGDEIKWSAIVLGVLTYETSTGSTNSIPQFTIFRWQSFG